MKIYSMTATFGKLEHQTLTLQPGLNIIEAPNEWGKSTWCAFLVNMLYGIDTRVRTTGTVLADKERYAPWSGAPMSGRIDLNWNGRDITVERSTKGRVIFGNFRAFETDTGIDVPELNGLNCGQMLLGVERSVFTRAGFLKQSDLPVTQDESLRRRLNNLVTTGDESGAGDRLGEKLKELKNKCRYNRTGLLPQAEAERDQLQDQLASLHSLQNKVQAIRIQQAQVEQHIALLENHAAALRYTRSLEDAERVAQANAAAERATERLEAMTQACARLPARDEAQRALQRGKQLEDEWLNLEFEEKMLPPIPRQPAVPEHYRGVEAAAADKAENDALEAAKKKNGLIAGICLGLAAALLLTGVFVPGLLLYLTVAAVAAAVTAGAVCVIRTNRIRKTLEKLYDRHPGITPSAWITQAEAWAKELGAYEAQLLEVTRQQEQFNARRAQLQEKIRALAGERTLEEHLSFHAQCVAAWDALADARRDLQRLQSHAADLRSMARPVEPPQEADRLDLSAEQTERMLSEDRLLQRQLHIQLGQCQGQTESLGAEERIKARLDTLNHRIARLEDTYYALEMALDALRDASNSLQRRFAPRISKRAQELFERLTGGRYQRLSLGQDLALSVSAEGEDTLYGAQWRSDGTADQLYLALRLAVAEELTPEAPLVLDDALVRFDDDRLRAAMKILKEEAQNKQVILFTCQNREKQMEETV